MLRDARWRGNDIPVMGGCCAGSLQGWELGSHLPPPSADGCQPGSCPKDNGPEVTLTGRGGWVVWGAALLGCPGLCIDREHLAHRGTSP